MVFASPSLQDPARPGWHETAAIPAVAPGWKLPPNPGIPVVRQTLSDSNDTLDRAVFVRKRNH